MKRSRRRVSSVVVTVLMAFVMTVLPGTKVSAAEVGRETVQINQSLTYTGTQAPGYTFESSQLSAQEKVGAMVFNITIDLPLEGEVSWNDWCGEALAVRIGDTIKYYDFGGAQVGWGTDLTGDDTPDTTGVGTPSWVGTAANGTCTVVVPINAAEFAVDFYDNCWDTAADINHYTINSATAVYGEVAVTELVTIAEDLSYTGLAADAGYVFSSSALTTKGNVTAVAFNISVDLPLEGEVSWNDWCGEAAAVKAGDTVTYYDFGGAQVGWGTDLTGDDTPDTTGVGTSSWVGSAENRSLSIVVPVDAEEFSITLYDNCWDTATDIPHLKINNAIALFGTAEAIAQEPTEAVEKPEIPAFDPNGTYHAYLGIQSESFIFRNPWSDASYGANGTEWEKHGIGNNFNGLTGWDGADIITYPAVFTDCEIKGNGTYQVSISDFDFGNDSSFNTLFVSTDIPLEGNNLTFTNIKVIMGGSTKYTFDQGIVPGIDSTDEKDYYEVHCINIWNKEKLGGEEGLFAYSIPRDSIILEFTVSGFAYDKAEETAVTEPPAATEAAGTEDAIEANSSSEQEGSPVNPVVVVIAVILACAVIGAVVTIVVKNKPKKQ
ncbi:hypothetical protein HNQ56_002286 [Anaerotaenia torta]|uniref:hypothetical protein n=1 Tax=Anaerotaenia torta TaxID=433293 RepID=UPI003D1BCA53